MTFRRTIFTTVSILVLSFSGSSQETSGDRTIIRVLSYNIHHGSSAKGDFDPSKAASVIIKADPDLVALQEIDSKTSRVNNRDLVSELIQATGMYGIFGKATDFAGGEYGQVILSKNSFLRTQKIILPGQPGKEPRIAVEAYVQLKYGDTIQFLTTHLDHDENSRDRVLQAQRLNELRNEGFPAILAGDLNDTPKSETVNLLEGKWGSVYSKRTPQPTFPSTLPKKKIDFIMFYPKHRWTIISTEIICDEKASDHCAVLAVLELLPK
ncbi:endonuclease/exonuclease/phosphatase family protein [Salinimicrobium sp. GXAS 041]|uniref:endonuclease/exonuclease/phosphatase family protein n=1 Tax=Salinimicrobium sp. GXAS 041 TaxID=3400806 RepID=UPI003C744803